MEITFAIDIWLVLQLLVLPVVLPLLVGLVTTRVTSSNAKALLLLGLSVVTSLLSNMLAAYENGNAAFNLGLALFMALTTFVFGVGMHYGLYKPSGASATVQRIGSHSNE